MSMHADHRPSARGRWAGAALFWGAVALVLAWNFPYHRWLQHANELPRIFMTMALVEEGSFAIDTYRREFGYRKAMDISRSFCISQRVIGNVPMRVRGADGRMHHYRPRLPRRPRCAERHFSNKAPGMSMLAAVSYAGLRLRWKAQGLTPDVRRVRNPRFRQARLRQAVFWARLTTATLPAFAFLLLLSWWLRAWVPEAHLRRVAVVAYGLGTLIFTYSVQLMSHQLATSLLFSAFILVNVVARRGRTAWLLVVAGFLGAAALVCDYQLAFAAVPLAAYTLWTVRPLWRWVLPVLGAVPPLAVLLWYHHAAFGSAVWTGYEFLIAQHDQALHARGLLGITTPTREAFWGSFFRPDNGLVYFSPWLAVALLGVPLLWRWRAGATETGARRFVPSAEASFHLAVIVIYTYFISSITFWRGGWQTGPRYIAALLPCFVLPYALLLRRVRDQPLAWAAAVGPALLSVGFYAVLVTGFPHFPEKFKYPLFDLVRPLLRDGYVSYNLGQELFGLSGTASLRPYFVVLAGLGLYLAAGPVSPRAFGRGAGRRLVAGVLAVMVAAWMFTGYERLASRGMARARPLPVVGTRGETYGAFLRRAHRDIRQRWEPGGLRVHRGKRSPPR